MLRVRDVLQRAARDVPRRAARRHRTSTSSAIWTGSLREGDGEVRVGPSSLTLPYTFDSRFASGAEYNDSSSAASSPPSSPEELLGAAHAASFSQYVAALIGNDSVTPSRVHTTAEVKLADGPRVSEVSLVVFAEVEGHLTEERFRELAEVAKNACPISTLVSSAGAQIKIITALLT